MTILGSEIALAFLPSSCPPGVEMHEVPDIVFSSCSEKQALKWHSIHTTSGEGRLTEEILCSTARFAERLLLIKQIRCGMRVTQLLYTLRGDWTQLCEPANASTPRENSSVFYQDAKPPPRYTRQPWSAGTRHHHLPRLKPVSPPDKLSQERPIFNNLIISLYLLS